MAAKSRTAKSKTAKTDTATRIRKGIPSTMRAAAIDKFGPPSVLSSHVLPVPKTGAKEVLIAIHAAGVGVWDAEIRQGTYSEGKEKFPLVLGLDGAGIIVEVGKGVKRFKTNDQVWAYQFSNRKGGFYAEYTAVQADNVGHAPKELTLLEAGASAVTALTALQGIDDTLRLGKADTILVFGATGAVGTMAVQFAKRTSARVVATASTISGEQTLRELGIEDVFDARGNDVSARLRTLVPDGLTAVLALAGGNALELCIDQVVKGGRVAYPNGVEPEPRKRANIRVRGYDAESGRTQFARLNRAVTEARLKVVIERKYKLEEAAEAHTRVEQPHIIGRVVLQMV